MTSGSSTRASSATATRSFHINRPIVETALLVSALLAIGGFIGYWVYPPSAEYLYHQAEQLMASNRRHDWLTARDDFLDPLDSRFPSNRYREQTRKWRDKILLDEAEGRAAILSSPTKVKGLTEATNNLESIFVVTLASATAASERGDDLTAKRHWEEMAHRLKADDLEERRWYLLALERVKERDVVMRDRRQFVEKELELVKSARDGGRTLEAITIWNKLVEQCGHFTDLADLLPRQPPVTKTPETTQPPPSSPTPPPAVEDKTSTTDKRREADTRHDAGATDQRPSKASPDDKRDAKPATDEAKSEPGSAP